MSDTNDVTGAEELFASGRATLVVPTSVGPVPDGVPELRAGDGAFVDLDVVARALAGQVVVAEGGPTLAGLLAAQGLLDEFFVTIAPRVIAGNSARVAHGPDADASLWELDARLPRRRRLPLPPLLPLPLDSFWRRYRRDVTQLAAPKRESVRAWVRGGGRGSARR